MTKGLEHKGVDCQAYERWRIRGCGYRNLSRRTTRYGYGTMSGCIDGLKLPLTQYTSAVETLSISLQGYSFQLKRISSGNRQWFQKERIHSLHIIKNCGVCQHPTPFHFHGILAPDIDTVDLHAYDIGMYSTRVQIRQRIVQSPSSVLRRPECSMQISNHGARSHFWPSDVRSMASW